LRFQIVRRAIILFHNPQKTEKQRFVLVLKELLGSFILYLSSVVSFVKNKFIKLKPNASIESLIIIKIDLVFKNRVGRL